MNSSTSWIIALAAGLCACLAACGGDGENGGGGATNGAGGSLFGTGGTGAMGGDNGTGGNGGGLGTGGTGAIGGGNGTGGMGGAPECIGPLQCDDGNDCTQDLCTEGVCEAEPFDDGTPCGDDGQCRQGSCTQVFPCTEEGVRDAIDEGGGPHFFDCEGPTTVQTEAEIVVDTDVILDGESLLTLDAAGGHRVVSVPAGVTAELRRFGITGGNASGGGGVQNAGALTLLECTVSNNATGAASAGGGIRNVETMSIVRSVISDNSSLLSGGGLVNFGDLTMTASTVSGNNAVNFGGGIVTSGGTMTLSDSTVADNEAATGGGLTNDGVLTVERTTISGNTASAFGGGISSSDTFTVVNSTIAGNSAVDAGGGIFAVGEVALTFTTLSDNTAAAGSALALGDESVTLAIANTLVDGVCQTSDADVDSDGGNVESPGDTCDLNDAADLVGVAGVDLSLGPLQDNGGPTFTQALLSGSVAIDAVPLTACQLTEDQRQIERPQGAACDAGAFEAQQ